MKIARLSWVLFFLFATLFFQTDLAFAEQKIRVVVATNTLASIVREIAGEKVEIHYVASPNRNVHFIQPTPKDVLKVKKAQVFVHEGLDLEVWRDPLLVAAGNPAFIGQAKASIDVSKGVPLLEIPTVLSRSEGDLHIYGNPHYWLDPVNAQMMADNVAEGFSSLFPEYTDYFRENAKRFKARVDEKLEDWENRMAPYRGVHVVTYHNSWPYFAQRFGLIVVSQLEPKPGIPPTARHLRDLVKLMKEKGIKLIIKESYNESRTPKRVAQETGAEVLTLAQAVGETKVASDYIAMMEENVSLIEKALKSN